MTFKLLILAALLSAGAVLLAACGGGAKEERPATPTVAPTAAAKTTPTGEQPKATVTKAPAGQGDANRGKDLFTKLGCSACHSTGSDTIVGPGMKGVGERAGTRKPGVSADAYLQESIKTPNAFVVEGFQPNLMPSTFADLSGQEIA
ncbi:MAG: c-type cytochrome, partial [Chloroflexi bacterium]|nr:c-type cytochrome [Chloroflexota bacterium]